MKIFSYPIYFFPYRDQTAILSDDEAREVVLLLSRSDEMKTSSEESILEKNILNSTYTANEEFNSTVVHEGTKYHILEDGHYYFEYPGLMSSEQEMTETNSEKDTTDGNCCSSSRKGRLSFSTDPIRVISFCISLFFSILFWCICIVLKCINL